MKTILSKLSLMLLLCGASIFAQGQAFAEPKYVEIGKRGLQALSAGNIDQWMADFADNARYVWNNGDSLVGKAAIAKYWKDRRGNSIESISFGDQIWLGLVTTTPQATEAAGTWALGWYAVEAKYKGTGKVMRQWIHSAMHFDANDKVDYMVQYLDREPINKAMKK
jgi:hypothetical protein